MTRKKKRRSPRAIGIAPDAPCTSGRGVRGTAVQYNDGKRKREDGSSQKKTDWKCRNISWLVPYYHRLVTIYLYKRLKRDPQQINGEEERTKESISRAFIPRQRSRSRRTTVRFHWLRPASSNWLHTHARVHQTTTADKEESCETAILL